MHKFAWTFAKTCDSSCLCHGEGSSYHSIGEVNTKWAGVQKTIFWNQSAHGEASLKWCQILAFLWIGVLFCMGALGDCVALSTLWRLFNFKIFLAKKKSDLSYGAHQWQFFIFLEKGGLFFALKTTLKRSPVHRKANFLTKTGKNKDPLDFLLKISSWGCLTSGL